MDLVGCTDGSLPCSDFGKDHIICLKSFLVFVVKNAWHSAGGMLVKGARKVGHAVIEPCSHSCVRCINLLLL